MIKIADKVKNEHCLFINKYNTNNKIPAIFTNWFTFPSMPHNYQTPSVETTLYGKNAFLYGYKNSELYSESTERCDVELNFIS